MSDASSAGKYDAPVNHGKTPKDVHLVCFIISVNPPSNNVTSPLNLLIIKPFILDKSSASRIECVPTNCAMTPPLSISPTNKTGMFAACANPILAISPARRFVSAGLPAPSTIIKSAFSDNLLKLSITRGINVDFNCA